MKAILLFLSTLLCLTSTGQTITEISTKWNDAFTEWIILTDDEEEEGEINMTWLMQLDWTEWDYDLGDTSGSIRLKWKNDPNHWEINGTNEIITARTVWKDDPTQWRISNNAQTIVLKSRWANNFNEWKLKTDKYGSFELITDWENDPRVWLVEDNLDESLSIDFKIAILFIVTYHSSPKE